MLTKAQIALLHKVSEHARNANATSPYAVSPAETVTALILMREQFVKPVDNYKITKNGSKACPNDGQFFISLYF